MKYTDSMCRRRPFLPLLFILLSAGNASVNNDTATEIPQAAPAPQIDTEEIFARHIVSSMDDRLLAAQVLICGVNGRGTLSDNMKILLSECPAGTLIFFRYNLDTETDEIRSFLAESTLFIVEKSGVPPFLAVDHEGGNVNRFPRTVNRLPAALSYWELSKSTGWSRAIEKIENDAFDSSREISALGFNLNFAPVAEYQNDNNRVFLGSRSYGPDPVFAALASAAFIRGMERAGILCAAKHFPSSAGADPHYHPSILKGDRADLDRLAYPFALLTGAGARAIMVSHSVVPEIDGEIASLSEKVMGGWLRRDLGFRGIIISDDFSMAAGRTNTVTGEVLSPAAAAIRSLNAGSDMIFVWPYDIRNTHRMLVSALEDGRLSRQRVQEAATRILTEKIRMGLIEPIND